MEHHLDNFEPYTQKKKMSTLKPAASISKSRLIGLNKKVIEFLKEGDQYVLLFYNRKQKIIGIKPIKEPAENSYSMRWSKRNSNIHISCATFISYYEINHDKLRYFEVEYDPQKHMIFIYLDRMIKEVDGRK